MQGTALFTLLAILIPLIVAVFTNRKTPSWIQGTVAFVISVLVAVAFVFFQDVQQIEVVAVAITAVIVTAQSFYSMLWKPLGVTSWILEHLGNTASLE